MHVSFLFNALTLSLLVGANPLPRIQRRGAALPPKYTVNELDGFANQTSFPQVYRDNGGGGNINGVNIVVFSDTSVTADGAGRFGPLEHFVSNSVAVMEYVSVLFSLSNITNSRLTQATHSSFSILEVMVFQQSLYLVKRMRRMAVNSASGQMRTLWAT
jgi:hypothetical protein